MTMAGPAWWVRASTALTVTAVFRTLYLKGSWETAVYLLGGCDDEDRDKIEHDVVDHPNDAEPRATGRVFGTVAVHDYERQTSNNWKD